MWSNKMWWNNCNSGAQEFEPELHVMAYAQCKYFMEIAILIWWVTYIYQKKKKNHYQKPKPLLNHIVYCVVKTLVIPSRLVA